MKRALIAGWPVLVAALLVALWAIPAAAQGVRYDNQLLSGRGLPVAGANVEVCTISTPAAWAASNAYALNAIIQDSNGLFEKATTAGTSGTTQPTWSKVVGATTADNTVTWTNVVCTPAASIWSDRAETVAVTNPTTTSSLGNYGWFASPGSYFVEIYGSGLTTQVYTSTLPCDSSLTAGAAGACASNLAIPVPQASGGTGATSLAGANIPVQTGTITTGDCVKWASVTSLSDNGACGSNGVAGKPATSDAVLYVSANGSDANDGLSWGTAKANPITAINALCALATPGGTVWIGAGTFSVAPLDLTSCFNAALNNGTVHILVRGVGVNKTVLQASSAGTMFKATGQTNTFYGVEFDDLTLDGNSLAAETGIDAVAMNNMRLKNVRFINFSKYNVELDAVIISDFENVLMRQPSGTSAIGVFFTPVTQGFGGANSTHFTATNLRIDGMFKGIATDSSTATAAVSLFECQSCTVESGTGNGVELTNALDITLVDSDFEANAGISLDLGDTALNAAAAVTRVNIIGGFFDTSAGAAANSAKFDSVNELQFTGSPNFAEHTNFTANARLVGGTMDVANAPTIANSTVFEPYFSYTTTGTSRVYPSTTVNVPTLVSVASVGITNSGFQATVQPATLAANQTYTLPATGGGLPTQTGAITTGNCVKWASATAITDSGAACSGGNNATVAYNTASAATTASIATTTMATAGASGNEYVLNAMAILTAVGAGCTAATTLSFSVTYTDAVTGTSTTFSLGGNGSQSGGTFALSPSLASTNGVIGSRISFMPETINAAASTAVQYATSYTLGTGCTTSPAYYILPVLIQVK